MPHLLQELLDFFGALLALAGVLRGEAFFFKQASLLLDEPVDFVVEALLLAHGRPAQMIVPRRTQRLSDESYRPV
jgi:hypothetical protein